MPLTERAFTLLSHYFSLNDTFGYTARGIQKIVRRVSNRAGITQKVSPHVLRHTFAAACIKKGLSTRYLQMFLGHDHCSHALKLLYRPPAWPSCWMMTPWCT